MKRKGRGRGGGGEGVKGQISSEKGEAGKENE